MVESKTKLLTFKNSILASGMEVEENLGNKLGQVSTIKIHSLREKG